MEANSLRLLLVILGVIIIAAIYFYDYFKKKADSKINEFDELASNERIQPVMTSNTAFSAAEITDEEVEIDAVDQPFVAETETETEAEGESQQVAEQDVPVAEEAFVVQLAVLPKEGAAIGGTALLNALTELDLEFGDMDIFHCYERHDGEDIQKFHVANIVEPGTFPVGGMADFESTGIVLFFQTNSSINPIDAFESMLGAARTLSQKFDATLVDDRRNELSLSTIEIIRTKLLEFANL